MKIIVAAALLLQSATIWTLTKPAPMQVMCPMKVSPRYRGKWMVRYSAQPLSEKRNVA